MTGRIRLAGLWEQGCCGCVLPAGISTLATFSFTLLPQPPSNISELQCPQGSASCSVPCHGGAAAALHCPLGCCLCFPRSSSSCARRSPGSLRLGAGTVAEAGGGAGPLVSRFRVVLFPLGSLENVRKGGVDVHPCALPGSPSGSAVFSLEKALPVVSGERALGSVAKGGAQGSRAFTLQTLPSNCA